MASTQGLREQPSFRRDSPEPSMSPPPQLSRCVSTGSAASLFSGPSSMGRESMASSMGSSASRSSSASYSSRQSMGGLDKPRRRGYVRPQGTNFAKSAQSRESVLSLGSIAHLQYYFARTGLLDGKGGRLSKKKVGDNRATLDFSGIDSSFLSPSGMGVDTDSSYASMGSSPELLAQGHGDTLVESPTQEDFEYMSGEEDDDHPHMLPPTVSTYNHREKSIPHPPTLEELKDELKKTLADADKVLADAKENYVTPPATPSRPRSADGVGSPKNANSGWYELQGMHVLDIMTLAIRAAKMYYTAHDQPARLSAIKSERRIRGELLSVLDVLKRMATRNFAHGMRREERETMENWVSGVYDMLKQEEEMERADRKQRGSWIWLEDTWESTNGSWKGREVEREYSFMKSMDPDSASIPEFVSLRTIQDGESICTEFLSEMRTGLRLVKLHNILVRKSKRPFGAIDKWHTDFGKPYRSAENLRYWIKAAELRWEVILKVDVMGVVNGIDREALQGFEDAIWRWCSKVREEISAELRR